MARSLGQFLLGVEAGRLESGVASFCYEAIQGYIPRLWLELWDRLEPVGQADQAGSVAARLPEAELQRPIIVAAPHAEAIALAVYCHQRPEDEIELGGPSGFSRGSRGLVDAVSVLAEP